MPQATYPNESQPPISPGYDDPPWLLRGSRAAHDPLYSDECLLGDEWFLGDERIDAYSDYFDHDDEFDDRSVVGRLTRAVGGDEALAALSGQPLPDEPFCWEGIAHDIRPIVSEVLQRCDRWCDDYLDVEYRTACRRFLARAAAGDAKVFRRPARLDMSAAAVCWAIGRGNDLFGTGPGDMKVNHLKRYFGLAGAPASRGFTLRQAAGIKLLRQIYLGDPALLVSAKRREIIAQRDQLR